MKSLLKVVFIFLALVPAIALADAPCDPQEILPKIIKKEMDSSGRALNYDTQYDYSVTSRANWNSGTLWYGTCSDAFSGSYGLHTIIFAHWVGANQSGPIQEISGSMICLNGVTLGKRRITVEMDNCGYASEPGSFEHYYDWNPKTLLFVRNGGKDKFPHTEARKKVHAVLREGKIARARELLGKTEANPTAHHAMWVGEFYESYLIGSHKLALDAYKQGKRQIAANLAEKFFSNELCWTGAAEPHCWTYKVATEQFSAASENPFKNHRQKLIDFGFFLQKAGRHRQALEILQPYFGIDANGTLNFADSLYELGDKVGSYFAYKRYDMIIGRAKPAKWATERLKSLSMSLMPPVKKLTVKQGAGLDQSVESYPTLREVPVDAYDLWPESAFVWTVSVRRPVFIKKRRLKGMKFTWTMDSKNKEIRYEEIKR